MSVTVRTLLKSFSGLPQKLNESIQYLPVVKKNRPTMFFWLRTARSAQIVLLLSVLLVPTILPKMLDAVLGVILPPVTETKLFGLIERTHENPFMSGFRTAGRIVLYSGSLGTVIVLLLLHLPKAMRESASLNDQNISGDRTVLMEPPLPASSPSERFELMRVLGRGGMGIVHLARDTVLDRRVALKELHTVFGQDERLLQRFRQEAKILAQLTHPGIVQIFDFLERDGRFWIVMEFVEGGELTGLLSEGALPVPQAVRLGSQLAEALAFAHSRGVIHRDFKPSNVLLSTHGNPKITDFGIARLAQSASFTHEGAVLGSPSYMSPEQAAGKTADARADVYSLGVVLYQALAGKLPFEGENFAAILTQHISKEPEPLRSCAAGVPEELDKLILHMLAKDPEHRLQNMDDAVTRLRPFA